MLQRENPEPQAILTQALQPNLKTKCRWAREVVGGTWAHQEGAAVGLR